MRPLKKSSFCHSGPDPESRIIQLKSKPLDPPVKPGDDGLVDPGRSLSRIKPKPGLVRGRDDAITIFITFFKGLIISVRGLQVLPDYFVLLILPVFKRGSRL